MEQILSPIPTAAKLCGREKENPALDYRPTRHSLSVPCPEGELLYHTLTGELLLLSPGEQQSARQELIARRFLVPVEYDECRLSDDVHRVAVMLAPPSAVKKNFTILTTTDCNARCFYCYEMGRKRVPMSRQIAEDAANYMADVCGGEPVHLSWFGGEPLHNIEAIDVITSTLANRGIAFSSSMTSNGFYLTPDVSRKAVRDWHLTRVQITIDGTEQVYNRTKAFVDDCPNPFRRVLDNIEGALDSGLRIVIRLNVDKNNADDMADAVDVLARRFQGRDNCHMLVVLLRSFAGKVHEFGEEEEAAACYFRLTEKIRGYELFKEKPLYRDLSANRCMADSESAEVILPDGRLGKCEHFSETELIGDLYSPRRDEEMCSAWKERCTLADMPECADCPLYPRCISLKKCDWTKHGCPLSTRIIRTENLKRQLLQEYETWKKQQGRGLREE